MTASINHTSFVHRSDPQVGAPNMTSDVSEFIGISLALKIGMTSSYSMTFLIGFLGNAVGMYVVFRHTGNQVITNLLIANMAFADLLVCLFSMPSSVAHLYVGSRWIGGRFGTFMCKMVYFPYFVSLAASVFTIVAISLERFVAIFYPLRCEFLKSPKLVTVAIWAMGITCMIPFLFLYTVIKGEDGYHHCTIQWPWGDMHETYNILGKFLTFTFIFLYCCPVLFLALLYFLIGRKLWIGTTQGNTKGNRPALQKSRKKVIKLLAFIVLVFAVCWLPSHVMHYYLVYRPDLYMQISIDVKFVSFWISQANSSINPILYILLNDRFRKDFCNVIGNCFSKSKEGFCKMVPLALKCMKPKFASRSNSNYSNHSQNRRMSLLQLLQAMRETINSAFNSSTTRNPTSKREHRRETFILNNFRKTPNENRS